jgi:hypothetical protein
MASKVNRKKVLLGGVYRRTGSTERKKTEKAEKAAIGKRGTGFSLTEARPAGGLGEGPD